MHTLVNRTPVFCRPGVGGDVWTGCRVTRGNGFSVGHSVGHGQSANDPAQMTQVFHATIEDTSASYQIQVHLQHSSKNVAILILLFHFICSK